MTASGRVATAALASAPAKVILMGEHAVNRGGRALATAVELRVRCRVRVRGDGRFVLRAGDHVADLAQADVAAFAAAVDAARDAGDPGAIARLGDGDFLAPSRAVLGPLCERLDLSGLDAEWTDSLPTGCGLGSGAAANCALAVAAAGATGKRLEPAEVAELAWYGDLLAHGGIASALDSSTSAHGGVIEYDAESGARIVDCPVALPLVIGDTGVTANTGAVNAGVRRRLADNPGLHRLFEALDLLVGEARTALAAGALPRLGQLLQLNQLLLEKLGVSTEPIERLVDAALAAGAYGAKLSGSGGGGIVVALAPPDGIEPVLAAMQAASTRAWVASATAAGAQLETNRSEEAHRR